MHMLLLIKIFKLIYDNSIQKFDTIDDMQNFIIQTLNRSCNAPKIIFSSHNEDVNYL
jgi:hypothetical protein